MKKLIFILPLALIGCTKTYDCTITTITTGDSPNEMVHYYEFEGTKEDVKAFEESGTTTMEWFNNVITQTTECK